VVVSLIKVVASPIKMAVYRQPKWQPANMAVSSAKMTLLSGKTPRNLVEKITKIFPKWVCLNGYGLIGMFPLLQLECWGYSPFWTSL